jgi:myo-inositol-1(or 4)-monophosphatase
VPDLNALLELSKSVAARAGARLLDRMTQGDKSYVHCLDHPREIKAIADTVLEKDILQALATTGLPILSEESGQIPGQQQSNHWFIVDPLDGTFNFVKGLGSSAVSIALWEDQKPLFGVIYSLMDRQLVWGGAGMGAYADGRRISVSDTSDRSRASICTGFPVRFDLTSDRAMQDFWRLVKPYAKVRMLGSAAVSLLQVARGSADVYAEQGIMLWDVAAGLAIVEGAGGRTVLTATSDTWCYDVIASNAVLGPASPAALEAASEPRGTS